MPMLTRQGRAVLSWMTVAVVAVVIVSALISALRFAVAPGPAAPSANVVPPEVTLCQGGRLTFQVDPPQAVAQWAATGGTIGSDGGYQAGQIPGDYEVQVIGPDGERGRAFVHVVVCSPTPIPFPTATPTAMPTPTPTATALPAADPQGDVGGYATGAPVPESPAWSDIQSASVGANRQVVLGGQSLPAQLESWAEEGEAVLWISLYGPVPDPPPVRSDWLFALDVDGNTATGRPVGSARINPDLGMEAAVGVYYDPSSGTYVPYLLVWDSGQGEFVAGPGVVRYWMEGDRTLVAISVPLNVLQEEVVRITGTTLISGAVLGRAGVVTYLTPEPVADFYPDRPQ